MLEPTKSKGSRREKAEAAFEQATRKVLERASQIGTPVVVWEDEQVVELSPDQATERHRRVPRKT